MNDYYYTQEDGESVQKGAEADVNVEVDSIKNKQNKKGKNGPKSKTNP